MEKLIERFKNYEIIKYFILIELGKVERNIELEEEYKEVLNDYSNFLVKGIWAFKENFFKSIHANPIYSKLGNYSDQAYYYLVRTYPYCLELGGCTNIRDLNEALSFYALSRGADKEVAFNITEALKEYKLPMIGDEEENNRRNTEHVVAYTDIDSILASSLPYYQGENLYDTLVKLNDKRIAGFIEYLVMNPNALSGICCYQNESGVYYVNEGNHRIMTKKAMNLIDDLVGNVPMTRYPVKIDVNRRKDLNNGFGF